MCVFLKKFRDCVKCPLFLVFGIDTNSVILWVDNLQTTVYIVMYGGKTDSKMWIGYMYADMLANKSK